MKILRETKEQGKLLKGEESLGENMRTAVERLQKVLLFVKNLETKLRLTNDMSGVDEFIKASKRFIQKGEVLEKEFQIKERPGLYIFALLNPDKDVDCRMIVKISGGPDKKDQFMDFSGYYD